MAPLTIDVLNQPCTFKLHVAEPLEVLQKLALFFRDRRIPINNLQLHRYRSGEAMVIIYCHIEKDRIARTVYLLKQIKGIVELEVMH